MMGAPAQANESSIRALEVYQKLTRAFQRVRGELDAALATHALTENQLGLLVAIWRSGPQCQRALAETLFTSGASVTFLVDQLEERALVRREREDGDRRFVSVVLTSKGKRFIERITPSHAAAVEGAFRALNRREQAVLARLCERLDAKSKKK